MQPGLSDRVCRVNFLAAGRPKRLRGLYAKFSSAKRFLWYAPNYKENWPTVPIGALGAGTLVRWIYIERSKGIYDWSLLDAWVMTAQQHGVSFHYTNDGVPAWAVADRSTCAPSSIDSVLDCNAPPMNIQDWDDFVTALVTRYKGKITYYELWNEPDNQYWLAGAKSHTKPGAMKTSDMVMLTKHAHDIIRRIDPNAKIISPSFHGSGDWFMDQYYAAGGVTDVDIVSIHGYPESGKITPEGSISNHVNRLLPIISKYGLQNKPLWDTEIAWSDQSNNAITDPDEGWVGSKPFPSVRRPGHPPGRSSATPC